MTPTADTIASQFPERVNAHNLLESASPVSRSSVIVLQPRGALDRVSSPAFERSLEEALEQVTDLVIVDLLWITTIDACGISALVAGVQRAAVMGKAVSFQSMNCRTHQALEAEWTRQWRTKLATWRSVVKPDLEHFLQRAKLSQQRSISAAIRWS